MKALIILTIIAVSISFTFWGLTFFQRLSEAVTAHRANYWIVQDAQTDYSFTDPTIKGDCAYYIDIQTGKESQACGAYIIRKAK